MTHPHTLKFLPSLSLLLALAVSLSTAQIEAVPVPSAGLLAAAGGMLAFGFRRRKNPPDALLRKSAPRPSAGFYSSHARPPLRAGLVSTAALLLHPLTVSAQVDFGDAPVTYGIALHQLNTAPGLALGAGVDADAAPQPSPGADGDDTTGVDDEEGFFYQTNAASGVIPWQRGAWTQVPVPVTLSGVMTEGKLDVWVDWDANGTFDAAEKAVDGQRVHRAANMVSIFTPLTAALGGNFVRLRLTTAGLASAAAAAVDGEAEDHAITIVDPSPATTVQAYQRDGQVWITWDYTQAGSAQIYEVYRSVNPAWNNISQGELVASLFHADYAADQLEGELTTAFGGAARTNFTIPNPVVGNPPVTLGANKGLCVATVRTNGNFSYAVVPRGVVGIVAANKTPLVPQVFNAADKPRPQLQQTGGVNGYPVSFYSLWADGGNPGDMPRPDFPFMANRNRNAIVSNFIVVEPVGGVPAGPPAPVSVAVHSGDASATMWLPGQPGFNNAGLAPDAGYLVCMDDRLYSLLDGRPDAQGTRWLGYVPGYDATSNVQAFEGIFPAVRQLPAAGAVIQPYTQNRLNWTLDWLAAVKSIDTRRVSMFGHSGGGKGALLWSHAWPERFASVCLYSPALADFNRGAQLETMMGTAAQNLNTTLINFSGQPVPFTDTVYLTRSLSPKRDLPPTRIYYGQNEENWVVDANDDLLGDVIEEAKLADQTGLGVAFHWDQRQHGVNQWTQAAVSAALAPCVFSAADFWSPATPLQARRDDAAYQSRFRNDQSYPAFFNCRSYGHGDIGSITYGGVLYVEHQPWTGEPDACLPQYPPHTGDRRGTFGGYFDWITNAASANTVLDTTTQWACTVFLAGTTGPDGQPHGPSEVTPQASLQVDVAIRRPQNFLPAPATTLTWLSVLESTGAVQQSGTAVFDPDGVVRANGVNIPRDPARLRLIVASQLDFGDAPSCYPVTTVLNGARHIALAGFSLGAGITLEADGTPHPGALADGASDDGVTLPVAFVAGGNVNIGIAASAVGKVDAWIDWNADGDWTDAGEQVLTNRSVVAGNQNVPIAAPAGAVEGQTFARFRLSKAGGLTSTGAAPDGEVEDYAVRIMMLPSANPRPAVSTNPADAMRYTTNAAGDPVLQWLGRPGEMATLEVSANLVNWLTWFQVGAPAVTGLVEFPVPDLTTLNLTTTRAFYRLIRTPLGASSAVPCVPGQHLRLAFTHGGLRRTYSLYIPPQHPVSACPLALIMHGGGQSGPSFMGQRGGELFAAADTHGMILCFPDATQREATNTAWFEHAEVPGLPYINDQAFLDALVVHLQTVLNVDTHRLYAAGFSGGGQMTHNLGGRSTTNFAALAACCTSVGSHVTGIAGVVIATTPPVPKPMLIINLRDDDSFPFFGTADKLPAIDSVNHWALANGCPPPPLPTNSTTVGVTPHRVTTGNYLCPGDPVRFVVLESGGHVWPDAADGLGYNANVEVLNWFMTFSTP